MEFDRYRSADGLSQRVRRMVSVMLASLLMILTGQLRADPGYKVGGGKISFSVGSNVPFVKVSGSSSAVNGSGEGTIAGNVAQVRALSEVTIKEFEQAKKGSRRFRDRLARRGVCEKTSVRFQRILFAKHPM